MTDKERFRRLQKLGRKKAELRSIKARYDAVTGEIEEAWQMFGALSAKPPDGMPHGTGFKDHYPDAVDRLAELKKKQKVIFTRAKRLYQEIEVETETLKAIFKGNREREMLRKYFIIGISYRRISKQLKINESTVRRRILTAVREIPEERLEE